MAWIVLGTPPDRGDGGSHRGRIVGFDRSRGRAAAGRVASLAWWQRRVRTRVPKRWLWLGKTSWLGKMSWRGNKARWKHRFALRRQLWLWQPWQAMLGDRSLVVPRPNRLVQLKKNRRSEGAHADFRPRQSVPLFAQLRARNVSGSGDRATLFLRRRLRDVGVSPPKEEHALSLILGSTPTG